MPEGHTIHRYARLHRGHLVDRSIGVSSPQGRFSNGAALLDGEKVLAVEALGKHLFYEWSSGSILHVHLGLFGRFRTHRSDPPPPTDGTRLAMVSNAVTIYLSGPTACEVITPSEREALAARLGPDPLQRRASFAEFSQHLDRRSIPIAAALLDQKVIAGVGNVYRAEVLFLAGIDPRRGARDLAGAERRSVWDITRTQLKRGEKAGRIVTVEPADVGARRRTDLDRSTRLYVYKRTGEPCHRCDTPILQTELTNRNLFWCPTCQSN